MAVQPIALNELEIIGYADALPDGKGPAVVPPVFRHRTKADDCFVPPFRIAGDWLVDSVCISFAQVQELAREQRITLPEGLKQSAHPEHQLWVDGQGALHYQASSETKQNLHRISRVHLDAAVAALKKGDVDAAERNAGIALAANDQALEPRALIAACHALKGETKQIVFLRKTAEAAGFHAGSFNLLMKNYLETIPAETWEARKRNVEPLLATCQAVGTDVWIPFRFTEDEYRKFQPLLHEFRRQGGEREFVISCKGTEAVLMAERQSIRVACADAETWLKEQVRQSNFLGIAAETMLNEPIEIARKCDSNPERVRQLGLLVRQQVSSQIVYA